MKAIIAAKFLDIFSVLLVVSQLVLMSSAIYLEFRTQGSAELRFRSVHLAEELRHSSRDLTTAARGFIATEDPHYMQEFADILSIRNGTKARPDGRSIPLRVLMAEAGFKQDELRLLDIAQERSNDLTRIEQEAMKLVQGNDSAVKKQKATEMVYNFNYRREVQEIMAPISIFEESVNQRTLLEVQNENFLMRTLLIIVAVLLVINGFVFYLSTTFRSVDRTHEV